MYQPLKADIFWTKKYCWDMGCLVEAFPDGKAVNGYNGRVDTDQMPLSYV